MFAPKPFRSLIGKGVVHCEIFRIFGRAALASAVVSAGWVALAAGSIDLSLPPARRAWWGAGLCFFVASPSLLWLVLLGVAPVIAPPDVLNDALTGAWLIFLASFLSTSGRPEVSIVGSYPPSAVDANVIQDRSFDCAIC